MSALRLSTALACAGLSATTAFAGDTPGALIMDENFNRTDIAPWKSQYKPVQFVIQDGVLVGQQLNPDHSAVINTDILLTDARIDIDVKFEGAKQLNLLVNDMTVKDITHAGHIARVHLRRDNVFVSDDLTGRFNLKLADLPKEEKDAAIEGTWSRVKFGEELEEGRWYHLTFTIKGDFAGVSIDGTKVAELRSAGLAHARKDKIALNVLGEPGQFVHFDNLKVTGL